ncbi:MAG TPA: M48 family metalloprotease [Acidobacteriaceae bacterium]|nr:M48 family metalloprotease [Acidobacteriaceae bacterium]
MPPTLDGYVTRATSLTDFDVNGVHILCGKKAQIFSGFGNETSPAEADKKLYIGESITVYGSLRNKSHTMCATKIITHQAQVQEISGFGIIDRVFSHSSDLAASGTLLIRADGYPMQINAKTASAFEPPLKSLSDVRTNLWVRFQGKQRADGVVIATKANFFSNAMSRSENNLDSKLNYDPTAVDASKQQSELSKAFLGLKLKRIPPYKDAVMQARVNRIGESLVPQYQRALPATDATKINFRFQLIDSNQRHDAVDLPSGIILVPKQVVERLQNDSQLAAVLADNIASVLEKQLYRQLPTYRTLEAASLVSAASGVGLAVVGVNAGVWGSIVRQAEEQSGRVSLGLLQDAGYDIHEAPRAWWLLAPKNPQKIVNIRMPQRAAYLYHMLGTTWPPDSPAQR